MKLTFHWDTAGQGGRLHSINSTNDPYQATLQNLEYHFDAAGSIDWIKDFANGGQQQSFTYDAANRLTSAVAAGGSRGNYPLESYAYDPSANLAPNPGFESGSGTAPANWTVFDEAAGAFPATSGWRHTWGSASPRSGTFAFSFSTHAFGQLDADLVAAQPNTGYDLSAMLRGSLASAQGCGGWVVRALFYDANSQYLGYTNAASGNQPGGSYAQVGSRVTTPARTAWIKVSLLLYLSVGWVSFDDVSLKRVTLETSTKYYYSGGQRVARRVGNGSLQYLFGDHLGSAALETDSSFTKISELRYNAWGKLRYTDGTAPAENAFTYTGQRQEADLGLMFYNARWYVAREVCAGRFDHSAGRPGNPGF